MKKPVYMNIDINSCTTPYLNKVSKEENISEETLYSYMDQYANSGITDILINVFCQYSATDSKIWTTYADEYLQKTENGVKVDYTNKYKGIYKFNKVHGIDPHVVWFKRCREIGINPWLSVRMNDCHCPDEEAYFFRCGFFHEAREKGWMVGDKYGYFHYCFDYAVKEVRQKMLDYIEEQINRYDVYGIELDFQREIICFDYLDNKNCAEIMNDFMREAVKIIKNAENIHGHEIKIAVRLQRDIEQNLIYGFDAKTWDKEKLVDIIVVTPRWETCDTDMPISQWVETLKNTEIVAGIETLISQPHSISHASPEHVRGMMNKYLQQGSEGTYLFNFFTIPWRDYSRCHEIFRTCTDLETVQSLPQRHALGFQDIAPEGCSRWKILPAEFDTAFEFEITTGKLPVGKKMSVVFGFEIGSPADSIIEVNGKICDNFEEIDPFDLSDTPTKQLCEGKWNDIETHYFCSNIGLCDGSDTYKIKITSNGSKLKLVAAEVDVY